MHYECSLHHEKFPELPKGAVERQGGRFVVLIGDVVHFLYKARSPRNYTPRPEGVPPKGRHVPPDGVRWAEDKSRWIVRVKRNGKRVWVGSYLTEADAIKALEAAQK
jgi:AP2 domain